LRLRDSAEADLKPDEVRVEVRAVALNARDLMMSDSPQSPDLVACSDASGEIVEIGTGVSDLHVGNVVVGAFFAEWPDGPSRRANLASALGGDRDGVLAERVVLKASAVVRTPPGQSFAHAAAFPCAGVTAWSALVSHVSPVTEADTVLTLGTGGVAIFALQIAQMFGARTITTTSMTWKREKLRELGADVVIDYAANAHWHEAVRAASCGRGVDFVVETGGERSLRSSIEACAPGGCVTTVRPFLGDEAVDVSAKLIHGRGLTLRGVYVGPTAMLRDALRAFAAANVQPVIDRSFHFDDAPAAFAHLRSGTHLGKIVIER
jgi:NADPH:quinone reductase-like Zn-dependent oxidoreductase